MRQNKQSELFTKKIHHNIFLAPRKTLYLHPEIKTNILYNYKIYKKK